MDFSKYEHKLGYPKKPLKPQAPLTSLGTAKAFRDHADKLEAYESLAQTYEAEVKAYDAETAELYGQFKVDALKEVGLWGHEAGNRAFEYAWNRGSGSGYHDVFYILEAVSYVILGPK